jgi:hypothetical protein
VENVGDSALNRLGELLLDLLRNDGCVTTVLGVSLVGGLVVGVGASGVDLRIELASILEWRVSKTYALGEVLLKTLGCDLLDALGDSRLAAGVGLALTVFVGGRHSDGRLFEDRCLLDEARRDGAEFEWEGHVEGICMILLLSWRHSVYVVVLIKWRPGWRPGR